MLKEMTDLMAQVSAARERHICDKNHFHPRMEPHHILMIMATLAVRLDELEGWTHDSNRKMTLDALGHMADICRRYLSDELPPMIDMDTLEETLRTDSISAGLILQATGIEVELVDGTQEQRVVH